MNEERLLEGFSENHFNSSEQLKKLFSDLSSLPEAKAQLVLNTVDRFCELIPITDFLDSIAQYMEKTLSDEGFYLCISILTKANVHNGQVVKVLLNQFSSFRITRLMWSYDAMTQLVPEWRSMISKQLAHSPLRYFQIDHNIRKEAVKNLSESANIRKQDGAMLWTIFMVESNELIVKLVAETIIAKLNYTDQASRDELRFFVKRLKNQLQKVSSNRTRRQLVNILKSHADA